VATNDDPADRVRLVAAAYVMLQRDDAVLLQLRRGTGYLDEHWALLAGHLEPGETITQAAVREAAEESGVRIEPADLEPLTTLHRLVPDGPQIEQRCDFFFRARRWIGEPMLLEPHRCADMRWFRLSDLPEPVVPHELTVLRHLAEGTVPLPILAVVGG
jgi:8-oxo-dGTP pyrophosphatase MutT (NUDIX family)